MIFLLLLLTRFLNVALTDDYPDFFAVNKNRNGKEYKVFTRVGECTVYTSGDQRVFFQDKETWKIANHGNLIGSQAQDCQKILNSVQDVQILPAVAMNGPIEERVHLIRLCQRWISNLLTKIPMPKCLGLESRK